MHYKVQGKCEMQRRRQVLVQIKMFCWSHFVTSTELNSPGKHIYIMNYATFKYFAFLNICLSQLGVFAVIILWKVLLLAVKGAFRKI